MAFNTGMRISAADLMAEPLVDSWVVPGLLRSGSRTLLAAQRAFCADGVLAQIAAGAAAGVHPFTGEQFEPVRVLYVDARRDRRELRNLFAPLLGAEGRVLDVGDRLALSSRPFGLDLGTPGRDEGLLFDAYSEHKPQLVVVNPVSGLLRSTEVWESSRAVLDRLDVARHDFGAAIVLGSAASLGDADAPGGWRPYGSNVWLIWADSARAVHPVGDGHLKVGLAGRMDRDGDGVTWPGVLRPGWDSDELPWVAVPAKA